MLGRCSDHPDLPPTTAKGAVPSECVGDDHRRPVASTIAVEADAVSALPA
jgi:hypothetical protein